MRIQGWAGRWDKEVKESPSKEMTGQSWHLNKEGEEAMLVSGEGSWGSGNRTCRGPVF